MDSTNVCSSEKYTKRVDSIDGRSLFLFLIDYTFSTILRNKSSIGTP